MNAALHATNIKKSFLKANRNYKNRLINNLLNNSLTI
jgi:hypothetical protein